MQNKEGVSSEVKRVPAALIIMDGFGLTEAGPGNAISLAETPNLDAFFAKYSHTKLKASDEAVGLPEGQMGNSEVGHLNIGAGRVVYQELTRINKACAEGALATNAVLQEAFSQATQPGAALHLMGLLSDGGVHSTNTHLYALIEAAVEAGVRHIMIHVFMDGRDVAPMSGVEYLRELIDFIERVGLNSSLVPQEEPLLIEVASISGRYYAMDRDNRWNRVEKAYAAVVEAQPSTEASAVAVIESSYEAGITDEFIEPVALQTRGMREGDAVVFFNFRPDRARELTRALIDVDFTSFERSFWPQVHFVCLTEYDPTFAAPVAFPKEFPENVLADVLAAHHLRQFHIAETEKYAHVTFFLNGGREAEKEGETRCLIPSPKVATYDLQPEMSAPEVTRALVDAIRNDEAEVYIVNFANCDMVGHTGVLEAARAAVEAVDAGVGEVVREVLAKGGFVLITADHGNADCMIDEDGGPFTAHTTNLVPFILADEATEPLRLQKEIGSLADIAPTLLTGMGISVPSEMNGCNLLAS